MLTATLCVDRHLVPLTLAPTTQHDQISRSDKRYNVIVFGVEECKKGTSRSDRMQSDLESVVSVLTQIVPTIQSQSIKDSYRLGKFNPSSKRPRPILIKMIQTADVSSILANKRFLMPPLSIKPDLSPEQRLRESILLKERWKLIQDGTERKDIRIKNNGLYVHNKLYGRLVNSVFHPSLNDSVTSQSLTSDPSTIVQPPSGSSDNLNTSSVAADNLANPSYAD